MIALYFLVLLLLGVYSYSQIDLNLTLLQTPWFLSFQQSMIQLGYFNRPLSTVIFVILVFALFTIYYLLLTRNTGYIPSKKQITFLIIGITLMGVLSYPAFSYDIFNYMFDAKILTHYGQNPYLFKALDFTGDPWLRFMHWTHRTYPYGPFWLLFTAPLSLLGFGKFILTLVNFKIFFIATYVINLFLLKKVAVAAKINSPSLVALTYALNPLVVIESVISPHLDSFMTLFMLLAVLLWLQSRRSLSFLSLLVSVGVKFITAIQIPIFLWQKVGFSRLVTLSVILLLAVLAGVIAQRDPYPWYFLPVLALICLLPEKVWLQRFAFFLSLGLVLTYAPYIFVGSYPPSVLTGEYLLFLGPVILLALVYLVTKFTKRFRGAKLLPGHDIPLSN